MSDRAKSSEMPGRLLRLLTLLQTRGRWSAEELSDRLGVGRRTLRRDIDRLRALDYPVRSRTGPEGGYSLGGGTKLPPLQLADEEAVAVAIALASYGGGAAEAGIDSARIKIERLLPARLRGTYRRLADSIDVWQGPIEQSIPDADTLIELADAATEHRQVSFMHERRDGGLSMRQVQPHRLATLSGRWYLVAFDCDRNDWRSFRVDRINRVKVGHHRFEPAAIDAVDFLQRSFAAARYRFNATVSFGISAVELGRLYYGTIVGEVIDRADGGCDVHVSADSLDLVAQTLGRLLSLDVEGVLDVEGDEAVLKRLRTMRRRLPE
ncbi:helix-turn-helix transcriptional regulator [Brevibacterium spongiae]|uniref:WYL domain-containing protein n=1 Tax=Brevibacterium spongiae TaxID=2909672 RepID=A0ABY5SWK5_9MICO|nr:WYL domain-containing protein [Brevibacterium spongiae]UVI37524.1 WYL domain-containing protein [Brevibacterium spongiae]